MLKQRDQLFHLISHFNLMDKSVQIETVMEELDRSPEINELFYEKDDVTPLILAVKNYRVAIVELLLKRGADPNAPDSRGARPLVFAIMKNDPRMTEIAELLLEYGANPTLKSKGGQSAIDAAELCGKLDFADRLRQAASKLEAKGPQPGKRETGPEQRGLD